MMTAASSESNGLLCMDPCWTPKESNILAVGPVLPQGMRRSMWSTSHYDLYRRLHKGYASHVYSGTCHLSGQPVVIKVYNLALLDDLQRVHLYREISIHSRLQHKHVVPFYAAFLEEGCVGIVQEYAGRGDLLRFVNGQGGRLGEKQAVQLVLQPFLSALQYLHSQEIIHRDIKPENCLLTQDLALKLGDFGLAVDLRSERANTRAGTLDYMAPEVLRCPIKETPGQFKQAPSAECYELGADAWALGVFAYELLVGRPPFRAAQMIETARNIIHSEADFPPSMSPEARDFIASCLKKHVGDRPTVAELMQTPLILKH